MKIYILFAVTFQLLLTGCAVFKKSTDRAAIKYVSENTQSVIEAAEFAVSVTYDQPNKDFLAKDVRNPEMRKKIMALGISVYVTFSGAAGYEIPDSNVTFKTITLFGVTEVIYDFAARHRTFADVTINIKDYYFIKL